MGLVQYCKKDMECLTLYLEKTAVSGVNSVHSPTNIIIIWISSFDSKL